MSLRIEIAGRVDPSAAQTLSVRETAPSAARPDFASAGDPSHTVSPWAGVDGGRPPGEVHMPNLGVRQRRETDETSPERWRVHIMWPAIVLYAVFAVAVTVLSMGVR